MSSLGDILRKTRESRGMTREHLAQQTRIRLRHLEALESGAFHELPGKAFNEGFVRLCATTLGIDPEILIEAYRKEERQQIIAGKLPETPDALVQLKEHIDRRRRPHERLVAGLRLAAPLVALVAFAVVAWYALPWLWAERDDLPAVDVARSAEDAELASHTSDTALDSRSNLAQPTPLPALSPDSGKLASRKHETGKPVAPEATKAKPGAVQKHEAKKQDVSRKAGFFTAAKTDKVASPDSAKREKAHASTHDAAQAADDRSTTRPKPKPAKLASSVAPESQLTISESGIGSGIVNRELADRKDRFRAGEEVFFWTRVLGGRKGDRVKHVWKREGRLIGVASLSIGGAHWRTHSRRTMSEQCTGTWLIEARDANDRLLATHSFECVGR